MNNGKDHAAHTLKAKAAMHEHGHDHGAVADPRMADAMEREMRQRFFVALALSIPIVWLS